MFAQLAEPAVAPPAVEQSIAPAAPETVDQVSALAVYMCKRSIDKFGCTCTGSWPEKGRGRDRKSECQTYSKVGLDEQGSVFVPDDGKTSDSGSDDEASDSGSDQADDVGALALLDGHTGQRRRVYM